MNGQLEPGQIALVKAWIDSSAQPPELAETSSPAVPSPIPDIKPARVTLLDRNNRILAHLGEGPANFREVRKEPRSAFPAGKFISPHDACFDREGNIFVAEWVPIGRVTKLRRLS